MISGVAFANPDYAQGILNKRLSINLKNVTLEEALNNIKNKVEVKFVYSSSIIPLKSKVSVNASQEKLSDILNKILIKLDIDYSVNEHSGYIILKKNYDLVSDNTVKDSSNWIANIQDHIVTGKVTVKADGTTLPGVSIMVKGTKVGTVTDIDGNFKINVPNNASILVFTYISFDTQEVTVGESTVINVQLTQNSKTLNEVVVTAAGIRREKSSLGYSVSTVNADKLAQKSEPDPLRALTGKVAGVNIQ
ncbi:MAG TPA: carboxypeptidase-like regulatory domain-containing protein, partial [Mucilaginibacter sp.]|nr:carboxypeptidase-like regulatory domain-containing protein [Mucilaginibacter sp.]